MTHSQQINLLMAGIAAIAVFYATESQAVDINVPKITVAPTTLAKLPKSVIDLAKVKAPAPTTITVPVMPRPATTMTAAPALKATSPAIQAALKKISKVVPQATPKSKAALPVPQRHAPVVAKVAAAARHTPSGRTADAKAIERTQRIDKHLLGGKLFQGDLAKSEIVALPDQVQGKAQRPDPVSGALPERQNTALAGGSSLAALPTVKPVIGIQGVDFATRTVGGLQDPRQQTYEVYNNDPAAIAMARNAWISNQSDDSPGKVVKQAIVLGVALGGGAQVAPILDYSINDEKFPDRVKTGAIEIAGLASGPVGAALTATAVGGDPAAADQAAADMLVTTAAGIAQKTVAAGAATGAPVAPAAGAAVPAAGAAVVIAAEGYVAYRGGSVFNDIFLKPGVEAALTPEDATNERGLGPSGADSDRDGVADMTPNTEPEPSPCGAIMSCNPPDSADNDGASSTSDDNDDQTDTSGDDDGTDGNGASSDNSSDDGSDANDEDDTQTADSPTGSDDDDTASTADEEEEETYCAADQDDCGGPTLTPEEMEAWGIIARDSENWDKTPNPEADPVREIDPIEAEGLMAAATAQKLGLVTTPNPEGGSSAPMPELTEEERLEYQRQMREHRLAPLVYPSPEDN